MAKVLERARNIVPESAETTRVQADAKTLLARMKVPPTEEGSFTSKDGVEIAWSRTGSGPPMVLCNGIGCDAYAWKYVVARFAHERTIIRWHYRGHGKSGTPKNAAHMTMEHVRNDLAELFTHLALEDVMLAGHSMGVQVALDFFMHHGARVHGMILLCGAPGRPLTTLHNTDLGHKVLPYILGLTQRFPRAARWLWRAMLSGSLPYEITVRTEVNGDFILRDDFMPYFTHLRERMDPLMFFSMLASLDAHDVSDRLIDVDVPTLIVAGERDTFTPAWLSERMHAQIPSSELLYLPGGSHTAPIEFPEIVGARLSRFLRERF
jgi:pimeloyl-ACP methyl ester carboxylesterase